MNVRPLAAVAVALLCASAAPSSAGGTVTLDGVRRTHTSYKGEVTDSIAMSTQAPPVLYDPVIDDCKASPGACDITSVRLTLPAGTSAGRFKVTVTMPRELNGHVGLFDREGQRVATADVLQNDPICCTTDVMTWKASFTVARLAPGDYTLVVFDRGGMGTFTAELDYKAYPPDRQRGKNGVQ